MEIENTSDQHSARETVDSTVESAQLLMNALDEWLQKLQEMGLEKEREITVIVGTKKVYQGTVSGDGNRNDLDEKQAKTLHDALDAKADNGSVRVLDQDKNLLFHSKGGVILKNELQQLQKQTEAPQQEASKAEGTQSPEKASPATVSQSPTVQSTETQSSKLDLSQGQIPQDLGITQLKGVDPNRIAEVDKNLAISWGVALEKVAAINESRRSVGDNNPAIADQVKLLSEARDSIEQQIQEKGYTNEQLLGAQTQKADYSQSKDIPSLDDAESQAERQPSQSNSPVAQEAVKSNPQAEPTSNQVKTTSVEAPQAAEMTAPGQQPSDAIGRQTQINKDHLQPEQNQQKDPLEELGHIAINQAEQIAELQAKLMQVSGKLDELTAWKDRITPVKLANEHVGNWFNQQRDKMASKVHSFANRLAATAAQKFEQVQDQVTEKVDEGMERHTQAVDEVKTQAVNKVGEVRESLENRFSEAKERHNQALSQAGQKAAGTFMDRFVEPAAKVLVSQMERVQAVKVGEDGTKSFEAASVSWNVHPDGSTSLTRKADGETLTPQNVTAAEMKGINEMVQTVDRKYGIQQSQTQSQSVAPSPTQEVKRVVQKV